VPLLIAGVSILAAAGWRASGGEWALCGYMIRSVSRQCRDLHAGDEQHPGLVRAPAQHRVSIISDGRDLGLHLAAGLSLAAARIGWRETLMVSTA
jgi:hypothetical protein